MSDARILVIDIETSPLEGYIWRLFDENVGLDQIKTEWSILSYCAKWLEEKKVIYDYTGGRGPKRVRDDKRLMRGLWKLLDAADIVIAQNGKKFDIKKINARLIEHGFRPYSPVRIIDTYLVARKHFGFTSNKLAWQSAHLTDLAKSEHKKYPGFTLWKACLDDDPKAWAEMRKYNIIDVLSTEKVYLKQRPWIENHVNLGTYAKTIGCVCPKCGSGRLQSRGIAVTQQGKYVRMQCLSCSGWSRSKTSEIDRPSRKRLLAN